VRLYVYDDSLNATLAPHLARTYHVEPPMAVTSPPDHLPASKRLDVLVQIRPVDAAMGELERLIRDHPKTRGVDALHVSVIALPNVRVTLQNKHVPGLRHFQVPGTWSENGTPFAMASFYLGNGDDADFYREHRLDMRLRIEGDVPIDHTVSNTYTFDAVATAKSFRERFLRSPGQAQTGPSRATGELLPVPITVSRHQMTSWKAQTAAFIQAGHVRATHGAPAPSAAECAELQAQLMEQLFAGITAQRVDLQRADRQEYARDDVKPFSISHVLNSTWNHDATTNHVQHYVRAVVMLVSEILISLACRLTPCTFAKRTTCSRRTAIHRRSKRSLSGFVRRVPLALM
jgi:hypothetical protein